MARLMNKLIPGCIKTEHGVFAWTKKIVAVRRGMREYGVPEDELFPSNARNINAVVMSLVALARTVLSLCFLSGLPTCSTQLFEPRKIKGQYTLTSFLVPVAGASQLAPVNWRACHATGTRISLVPVTGTSRF